MLIAKLIDCDCKVDLLSGGLEWPTFNHIANLSWSWVVGTGISGSGELGIFTCTKNTSLPYY